MEIQNKKLDEGVFMQERQEVLGQWPTGKDVDLQEAADYQKRLSPERVFSTKLLEAKKAGRTLIQPRAGVPVIEEHIKLMQYLEKEGEADLLPTTIDSYTRQNRYAEAEDGIQESIRARRAMLNGFPAVNHGVGRLPARDRERPHAAAGAAWHPGRASADGDRLCRRLYQL